MFSPEQQKLLSMAKEVSTRAYAPYSNIKIGAAILVGGEVCTGVNIENSSYGLSLCAERAAMAQARLYSNEEITGIAIYSDVDSLKKNINITNYEVSPCGACRQWFIELAPHAWIVTNTWEKALYPAELLLHPFHLK